MSYHEVKHLRAEGRMRGRHGARCHFRLARPWGLSLGHRVVRVDVDEAKIHRLRTDEIGIRGDGLAELVNEGVAAGRLSFVVGAAAALAELQRDGAPVEVMFLCVPTQMGVGGIADLAAVEVVIEEVCDTVPAGAVVVNKSPVRVGTAARTGELLERDDVAVGSNPGFRALDWPQLSEVVGTPAVIDTRNLLDPDVLRRAAFTWTGVRRTMRTAALTRTGFSI